MVNPLVIVGVIALLVALAVYNEQRGKAVMRATVQARRYPADAPTATVTPGATNITSEVVNERPARDPKLESEVLVPLGQTLITSVIVGIVASIAVYLFDWPWRWALGIFGLAIIVTWLWRLGVGDQALWIVERVIHTDITGDGHEGKPPEAEAPEVLPVNTGKARSDGRAIAQAKLDAAAQDGVIAFFRKCLKNGTSEEDHNADSPGKREKHNETRDLLMRLGLATWNSPTQHTLGWSLTADEARAVDVIRRHVRAKEEAAKEYDR